MTQLRTADFRRLLAARAPFTSVYLPAVSHVPDAPERLATNWQNARRALASQGVGEDELAELEAAAQANHRGGSTRYVLTAADGTSLSGMLPDVIPQTVAVHGSLPRLLPLLDWSQSTVAHVVAVADRTGAELLASDGEVVDESEIEGETEHIHRGHPGGWSQRRFQQRAENTWEDNAADVAEAIVDLVDEVDAQFVALAGDVRAVGFIREHLPDRVDKITDQVSGSRHDQRSQQALVDDVTRLEADLVARRSVDLLGRLREAGAAGLGVEGPAATLQALRRHQVDTLVCEADTSRSERARAFIAVDDHTMVGLRPEDLDRGADAEIAEVDLADATVAAAFGSGADIWVMPPTPSLEDGLGALLRFADDPAADEPT